MNSNMDLFLWSIQYIYFIFFKSSRILLPNLLSGKFFFHDYFPVSLDFFRLKNIMINIIHVLIITYIHRILYVHGNAYAHE